ncbi:MAG TPA: HlyD family efflux transporter periplasmic adaptor subunit [Geminicoccus sp.]|nr:HlyD family efflux transporter periplasmic adaptor subunit [Geminicoccus sp.]
MQQQCSLIGDVTHGVVVVGAPPAERFAPIATWPAGTQPSVGLAAAAELALVEGRGVISRQAGAPVRLLVPIILEGEPRGVVGLELGAATESPRGAMRQLEWGIAGLRERLGTERIASAEARARRADTALDSLAMALDQDRFASAAQAAVSELAVRLGCERVAIGFVKGERCRVSAISQSAAFGGKVELTRALAAAMDEAIEQRTSLIHPPLASDEPLVTRAQEQLARRGGGSVLTISFLARGNFAGALVAERPAGQPFDQVAVDQLGAAAALLGPVLDDKRRNDRWLPVKAAESLKLQLVRLLGPRHFGRKLSALGIAALVTAGWLATRPYQAVAEARVEGRIQRALVAPFDGFVSDAPVRAGDIVAEGQELARLDDRDLTLERLNRVTERQQRQLAYDRALGGRDRAEAGIARAQIEESDAQIELLDGLIERARLVAPFAGVVVAGDLSRSIGSTVRRGEVLFQVAPLDAYRVRLGVDESQIADIHVGQRGSLLTTSLPTEPFAIEVEQITPVAEARDGRTVFQVEANLESPSAALRPGMEGIAKIDIGERRLVWIWSRTLIDWLRLKAWAWQP